MIIQGQLYNGQSSSSHKAHVKILQNDIELFVAENVSARFKISELQISSRIGNIARKIVFPNGWIFETAENDIVDQVLDQISDPVLSSSVVHKVEKSWTIALAMMVVVVAACTLFYIYGLPAFSEKIAQNIPRKVNTFMGAQTRRHLQNVRLFEDSNLPTQSKTALLKVTEDLRRGYPDLQLSFLFYSSKAIGPNAFCLPGNQIVITDQLLELTSNFDEVRAVLLHEIGHAKLNHVMRLMIESSSLSLLMATVLGDVGMVSVPLILLQSSYSREKEEAADDFAAQELRAQNLKPTLLADILDKMATYHLEKKGTFDIPEFFSTHPETQKRITKLRRDGYDSSTKQ